MCVDDDHDDRDEYNEMITLEISTIVLPVVGVDTYNIELCSSLLDVVEQRSLGTRAFVCATLIRGSGASGWSKRSVVRQRC